MSENKKVEKIKLSRRDVLIYTTSGLLAGIAGPSLLGLSLAYAEEKKLALRERKVLTVYYSRTGNTQTMASYIHEMSSGNMVRIETVDPYPTAYKQTTIQAKKELESGYKPPLKTKIMDLKNYDIILIGSPCWWGTIATPVISFLSEYNFNGKTIIPFMTHLGSGLGRTVSHVRELCPEATVLDGKAIRGDAISSSRDEVLRWVRQLNIA